MCCVKSENKRINYSHWYLLCLRKISFWLFAGQYQRLNIHELNIKMLQPKECSELLRRAPTSYILFRMELFAA
jgi:hypothetical protein